MSTGHHCHDCVELLNIVQSTWSILRFTLPEDILYVIPSLALACFDHSKLHHANFIYYWPSLSLLLQCLLQETWPALAHPTLGFGPVTGDMAKIALAHLNLALWQHWHPQLVDLAAFTSQQQGHQNAVATWTWTGKLWLCQARRTARLLLYLMQFAQSGFAGSHRSFTVLIMHWGWASRTCM